MCNFPEPELKLYGNGFWAKIEAAPVPQKPGDVGSVDIVLINTNLVPNTTIHAVFV